MNWQRIIVVLAAGALISGCLSLTLRLKCKHQDFVIEQCYAYPRFSRDK